MTAKKDICFIIPTLTQGGAERVIINLIKHLDRTQFCITLMVVNMRDEIYSKEIPKDVNVIDLKSKHVRTAIPSIIFNIWKFRPDIVMSTIGYLNIAIGMIKFLMPSNIEFFARETIVVSERLRRAKYPQIWKFWYRYYYPRFDKVICQSRDMFHDLESVVGCDENLVLINNPVDHKYIKELVGCENSYTQKFFDNKSNIYLVASGRLIDQKGFDILIKAIKIVSNSKVKLAILGHGPLENELRALIEKCGLKENVFLIGYQENPYSWISQADGFILSSHYEGFPNVVLEALACQTPVISTPAPGGAKEILEKIPGCFLSIRINPSSLAEAISLFIVSKKIKITEKAIDPYTVKKITKQYENVFLLNRDMNDIHFNNDI